MPRFDATDAKCSVLTFKDGVLSAVAHDLRLSVERFTIEIDEDTEAVAARFDTTSLRVDCAMKNGRPDPGTLSARNKREIENNINTKVLHTRRYPEVVFRSSTVSGEGDERRVEGTLEMHGVQRPLTAWARRKDGRWSVDLQLHQPDFGVVPFTAMLGTLKVRAGLRVQVSVPG
ncbi:MAG: YceI family protein [Myxococcota bacterium]